MADDVRIALLGPLELRAGTALPVVEVAGSRLRRLLPGALESHPSGYRLDVPAEAVDAFRFEALARAGWPPRPRRGSWAGRPTGGGPGRLGDDVVAADHGPAPVGRQQRGQDPHRGGLAGRVGSILDPAADTPVTSG